MLLDDDTLAMISVEDRSDDTELRKHPAALAGCTAWHICYHCGAWMEWDDDDDDASGPDSVDGCEDCGEIICQCDDPPDSDDWEDDDEDGSPSSGIRSLVPSNDDQLPPDNIRDAEALNHPPDILEFVHRTLLTARMRQIITDEQENNPAFIAHCAGVMAQWPNYVCGSVDVWNEAILGEGETIDTPFAVLALLEQANANNGGPSCASE